MKYPKKLPHFTSPDSTICKHRRTQSVTVESPYPVCNPIILQFLSQENTDNEPLTKKENMCGPTQKARKNAPNPGSFGIYRRLRRRAFSRWHLI